MNKYLWDNQICIWGIYTKSKPMWTVSKLWWCNTHIDGLLRIWPYFSVLYTNCNDVIHIRAGCLVTGGYGDWRTDGCEIIPDPNDVTVVHCFHLSIFTILEVSPSAGDFYAPTMRWEDNSFGYPLAIILDRYKDKWLSVRLCLMFVQSGFINPDAINLETSL